MKHTEQRLPLQPIIFALTGFDITHYYGGFYKLKLFIVFCKSNIYLYI